MSSEAASSNGGRERLPYRLNPVIQELRDMSRSEDLTIENVIAAVTTAYQDDGVIDEGELVPILVMLGKLQRVSGTALNVLNLLDESGIEAAQREVERLQANRQSRQLSKRSANK